MPLGRERAENGEIPKQNKNLRKRDRNTISSLQTYHLMHLALKQPPCSLVQVAHVQELICLWSYQIQGDPEIAKRQL